MKEKLEEQEKLIDYCGMVWKDGEIYIQFDLSARDIDEARAMAEDRFGEDQIITVYEQDPPEVIEKMKSAAYTLLGENDPFKEYLGKLWVDGEPVVRFSLMARNPTEAYELAKAKYGDHRISVWNEEDQHRLR